MQYAMTLVSPRNLENILVKSSTGVMTVTSDFFISSPCVVGLKSLEGQVDESWSSQSGPCCHNAAVANVVGSVPLEMRSAGLDEDGTCLHVALEVAS